MNNAIAEYVLPGHPDRVCDRIADLIVDAACTRDPLAFVGVEVAVHRRNVFVTGCAHTNPPLEPADIASLAEQGFRDAGYVNGWEWGKLRVEVDLCLEPLDAELRATRGLADDQAICIGHACNGPKERYLPRAHRLAYLGARALGECREHYGLGPDGKVILALDNRQVDWLSVSIQHRAGIDRKVLYRAGAEVAKAVGLEDLDRLLVNGDGEFDIGGPEGDNGLSGKKLVVDAYGPGTPVGGGAWCGKDPHKIDRLGALRARWLAVRAVQLGIGPEATVTLGWRPGDAEPRHAELKTGRRRRPLSVLGPVDLSIDGTWSDLGLAGVRFADFSDGSWFQRRAPWEFDRSRLTGVA